MKNTIDFLKIDNGNLGAINFNNMIPIPMEQCIKIDVESQQDETYKTYKQIHWCNERENANVILNRAINKKLPQRIIDRCCDFKMLEEKSQQYK